MVNRREKPLKAYEFETESRISTTVSLTELLDAGARFEASSYDSEARQVRREIESFRTGFVRLYGDGGLVGWCSKPIRMKRVYVSPEHGIALFSSSDILNIDNRPSAHISKKDNPVLNDIKIEKYDVMVSRSGTIGNVGFAGDYHAGRCLTEDALRLRTASPSDAGFVAAFLRSRYGRLQVTRSTYGSVVQHIEPVHLESVIVPKLDSCRQKKIGQKFVDGLKQRDEALTKLNEARAMIHQDLGLGKARQHGSLDRSTTTKVSQLMGRFEASFHSRLSQTVDALLDTSVYPKQSVGGFMDNCEVSAVTKFRKRIYVEGAGIPLLTSKQLFQIDPVDKKTLGRGRHLHDIPEIGLKKNMILVTCSGTIGKVMIIPEYMSGWGASQDALRITSDSDEDLAYLYAWLSSEMGQVLIKRMTYGSVVVHIDKDMLSSLPVPVIDAAKRKKIASLVLDANALRDSAWKLEQSAIADIGQHIEGIELSV